MRVYWDSRALLNALAAQSAAGGGRSRAALGLLVIIMVGLRQDVVEVGRRWPRGFRPGALEGKDAGIPSHGSFP